MQYQMLKILFLLIRNRGTHKIIAFITVLREEQLHLICVMELLGCIPENLVQLYNLLGIKEQTASYSGTIKLSELKIKFVLI